MRRVAGVSIGEFTLSRLLRRIGFTRKRSLGTSESALHPGWGLCFDRVVFAHQRALRLYYVSVGEDCTEDAYQGEPQKQHVTVGVAAKFVAVGEESAPRMNRVDALCPILTFLQPPLG